MILIIPTTYFLLYSYFGNSNSIRIALINAYLVLSAQILFVTELLSLFNYLTGTAIFIVHLIFAIFYFSFLPKNNRPKIQFQSFELIEKVIIGSILFITFLTFIIAIFSPPNNWDSMTYHMSRIQYWIQNNRVDFFITNNFRQNLFSPFSEFVILNLQLLSNSDIFANLVQWFSLIISLATISLISKEFGLNRKLQLISAFFLCSMPIAILEASSTQNDIVLSAYILLFYYYQMCSIDNPSNTNLIFSGISLGLGILTKGTSYVFLFSIGIAYFIYSIIYNYSNAKSNAIYRMVITVFIGLTINIPHYIRSYLKYEDFLGLSINQVHTNEVFSIFTIFSNLIRHIAYQLGSNIDLANWYIYRFVQVLLGDKISDPNTSFLDQDFRPPFLSIHEDGAGNFTHTIIIIILCILSFIFVRKIKKFQLVSLWISLLSIVLYCLLFKWQPWTGKTLPLFIIISPFILIIMSHIVQYKKLEISIHVVLIIMFLSTLPYILYNKSRPLLPLNNKSIIYQNRLEGYFNNHPELFNQYKRIIDKIDFNNDKDLRERSIGLHIGGNSWDYPFWVMLKEQFDEKLPNFFHLKSENIDIIGKNNTYPDYIIFENSLSENLKKIKRNYVTIVVDEHFSLMKNENYIHIK